MKMEKLKKDIYNLRIAIIPIILCVIIMQITLGTICPLKGLIGIPCPACGLTHATIYLLTGNFEKAIQANPTVFLWLTTIMLFIVDRYIHKLKIKVFPYIFIITGSITIIWYIFKYFL